MKKKSRKEVGIDGENIAHKFLEDKGYKILKKNYSCGLGEVDIIALHKRILVFIEVKVRGTDIFGAPELAVTKHKRKQIIRVAQTYLSRNGITNTDCRFDVIAINYQLDKETFPEIKLLKDAFRADDI